MPSKNQNWGKPLIFAPVAEQSDFEHMVGRLNLRPHEYKDSAQLREWAFRNKDQKYVPPDLLQAWGFKVRAEV